MKPILVDGKITIKLHQTDIVLLTRVIEMRCLLVEMRQDKEGDPIREAAASILEKFEPLTVRPEAVEQPESES